MGKTPSRLDQSEDRYLVPGLVRGLAILDAFSPECSELSLSDIAGILGLSRSAAFRAVYTLVHLGFLLHDTRNQTYSLGPAVLRLGYGYMASRELVQIALPELERLRDRIDWSVHLGVRDGRTVIYLLRVPSRMGMGSIIHVGSRLPAASTTMGRVMLTDLEETELVALYRNDAHHLPVGGVPNMAALMKQWHDDRRKDVVIQIGNFERGITSVAAPVREISGGIVAAVNATHAGNGFAEPEKAVVLAVRECADNISRLLGHK